MRITIIGSGNMGGAIALGLAKGTIVKASDITCTARSEETLARLKAANAALNVTTDNRAAVRTADWVILAVKPWLVESVIREIRPALDLERQVILSVAAGITLAQLEEFLSKRRIDEELIDPRIIRVMPNTAIAVGSSMTFICEQRARQEEIDLALRLFNELGHAMLIEEKQMDAAMALASCGIAYALRYIRAAMAGGVELGIRPREAQEIVSYTVKGAADLLLANGSHPETEIDKVTTPGGITIKGLNEMEAAGFTSAVIRGLKASK